MAPDIIEGCMESVSIASALSTAQRWFQKLLPSTTRPTC